MTDSLDKLKRRISDKTVEHDDLKKSNRQASDDTKAFYSDATKYHVIINNAKTLETKLELTNAALTQVRNGLIELPGTSHFSYILDVAR